LIKSSLPSKPKKILVDSDNSKTIEMRDAIVYNIYNTAEEIASKVVRKTESKDFSRKLDDILTSPLLGFPVMLLLLGVVFWITITGANYPSQVLATVLFWLEEQLSALALRAEAPAWLYGIIVEGMYRTLAWVVSVMLPPMAIFFPLFTLLENLGYLPRVAFNLDNLFKRAGTHGKQALTMSMGFGCNAAGVVACRIIDSPREKLIAILTNNFVPCNGRFPTLILLSSLFMGTITAGSYNSFSAAGMVVLMILIGITVTLIVSWLLSKTLLKGIPSSFTLELPPYRPPKAGEIIVRSILDRTAFVLTRAIIVAAPTGFITWLCANIQIGDLSIIGHVSGFLDPFARAIGLDGVILMAFILGLPANEIVVPILIMSYLSAGAMLELDSLMAVKELFIEQHGWTALTALNTMLFSLLHFPCGTTLWTIAKETQSKKWAVLAFVIPTTIAIIVCFLVVQGARLLGIG